MKELIKYIAQSLVDDPDQVDVQEIKAQQTLVLELRVAKEDLGKVIGKKAEPPRPCEPFFRAPLPRNRSGSFWKSWNSQRGLSHRDQNLGGNAAGSQTILKKRSSPGVSPDGLSTLYHVANIFSGIHNNKMNMRMAFWKLERSDLQTPVRFV